MLATARYTAVLFAEVIGDGNSNEFVVRQVWRSESVRWWILPSS